MYFFFFQAEDGIRDHCVTGVQTCALPISFWPVVGIVGFIVFVLCGLGLAVVAVIFVGGAPHAFPPRDRKSTRLNSSHTVISYAVFCLKKKNVRITERKIIAITNTIKNMCM